MTELQRWRCVTPDDEEHADYRAEFEADLVSDGDAYFTARVKADGCVDMDWGDEYEHICDLKAKITLLQDLHDTAVAHWQARGGAEGWPTPEDLVDRAAMTEKRDTYFRLRNLGVPVDEAKNLARGSRLLT